MTASDNFPELKDEPTFLVDNVEPAFFSGRARRGYQGRYNGHRPYVRDSRPYPNRRPRGRNPMNG